MYYEERVVKGVLCWRNLPNGEWYEFTVNSLTQKINKLELELKQLQNKSHNNKYTAPQATPKSCSGCKHSMYCANCGIRA